MRSIVGEIDAEAVLVTRSEQGMSLIPRDGEPIHVPAYPVRVRDVSGAGDTVVAVFAVVMAAGGNFETALRAANAAAAVVVGKRGTATTSIDELRTRLLPHALFVAEEKIAGSVAELDEQVRAWRRRWSAHRFHQWRVRPDASGPRQGFDAGARRLAIA